MLKHKRHTTSSGFLAKSFDFADVAPGLESWFAIEDSRC